MFFSLLTFPLSLTFYYSVDTINIIMYDIFYFDLIVYDILLFYTSKLRIDLFTGRMCISWLINYKYFHVAIIQSIWELAKNV